jgi:hypothetical protein
MAINVTTVAALGLVPVLLFSKYRKELFAMTLVALTKLKLTVGATLVGEAGASS